ncbi:uncharacterized protein LOC109857149 [Pseudomyrmex gracilis]|uniref:uncharacterized protein LOC109857149 n=1 Tax=Pseudomyrmex gracilis TaxID=219809 RepID=UPI000994AE5E|nr:uncharacterized protein LOC109857149 [Pseudomyrmex gracilis]
MRSHPDARRAQVALLSFVAVFLMQSLIVASIEPNVTGDIAEDDMEELLTNMNLTTFKERYRRLIPYVNFFVANNYLQNQAVLAQNYAKELQDNDLPQQQAALLSRANGNIYRVTSPGQDKKFIPSVQFDPRNIGGDNDYFAPVKYNARINYEDYSTPSYQIYQLRKTYPEITTASPIPLKENRYYIPARPLLRPSASVREHLIQKPSVGNSQIDYNHQDYTKTKLLAAVNYPNKGFEGLRYIPAPAVHSSAQQQQSMKPSTVSQNYRKPNVNLNSLIESFKLSERLPERLNKNNLDSSVQTLVEILKILHNSRQENFPQRGPQLPPPVASSRLTGHVDFNKPKTRPKVITETRFQLTPSPLIITEDPDRYKMDDDVQIKRPPQSDYVANHVKNEKVHYYIPYVQDISSNPQQHFGPTSVPDKSVENSYEVTQEDDILQDEQYIPPISTEASTSHEYAAPNELTRPEKKPKPSVKYGATRGKPHVDYPAYAIIPETNFSCKDQRYKGFFGDPSTGCQVWHYCDLNGGKSSFLCPNGTIFSQIALTCDWWFNVKCETTTQLYVLNERLYKYILPIMPKFPEDFTGPEVDRYLELKFKEMEAKLKEKKLKKQQEDKDKHKGKPQTTDDDHDHDHDDDDDDE